MPSIVVNHTFRWLWRATRLLWPLVLSAGLFLHDLHQTYDAVIAANGHLVYALDDAYIHMSIAKNLATEGVWGVTPYAFSNSSSSPLWTLVLGLVYALGGVNTYAPYLLNIALVLLLLFSANTILQRRQVPGVWRALLLFGLHYAVRLDTLVLLGMEHALHALLMLLFVSQAVNVVTRGQLPPMGHASMLRLYTLAALLGLVRYEGLFVIGVCVGALGLRLAWRPALAVLAAAAIPTALFGLVAVFYGWTFIPGSVLLKADRDLPTTPVAVYDRLYDGLARYPIFTALATLLVFAFVANYYRAATVFDRRALLPLVMVGAIVLHVFFVQDDAALLRYSAYLVVVSMWAVVYAVADLLPQRLDVRHWPAYGMILLIAPTFYGHLDVRHDWLTHSQPAARASANIYAQQYQMALFVQRYYNDGTVALNDIGAVNYLSDARTVDVWGLGNKTVTDLRLNDRYDWREMERIVAENDTDIAIVYDDWLSDATGGVPPRWEAVGYWTVVDAIILGSPRVTFYAVKPAAVDPLIANLQQFKDVLPYPAVFQEGRYITELAD